MTLCLLSAICAISGCTRALNARTTLGGSFISPTLGGTDHRGATARASLLSDPVDATREAWRPTQFVVAFDGVVHGQTLRVLPRLRPRSTPREYGRYPSAGDVLAPQSHGWMQEFAFFGSELGRSIVGTPYAIGYLVWQGELDDPTVSPGAYKRTPQTDWSSGTPADPSPESNTHHE
jgi:hypothetical protein